MTGGKEEKKKKALWANNVRQFLILDCKNCSFVTEQCWTAIS